MEQKKIMAVPLALLIEHPILGLLSESVYCFWNNEHLLAEICICSKSPIQALDKGVKSVQS